MVYVLAGNGDGDKGNPHKERSKAQCKDRTNVRMSLGLSKDAVVVFHHCSLVNVDSIVIGLTLPLHSFLGHL